MQLLVVHHDREIGEGLSAMVRQYTPHTAIFVASDDAARAWLEQNDVCDLLLTQVEAAGIDGLALASSLGENFGPRQIFFLPNYARAAQRLEVTHTKIFPEPIDGERLLEAIAQAGELQDLPRSFHVVDLLQMFCLSGKSGAVELAAGGESGVAFLREGAMRHAVFGDKVGLDGICEMVARSPATFSFDPGASALQDTIALDWESALIEAVVRKRTARVAEKAPAPEPPAAPLPNEPDYAGLQFGGYQIGRKLSESSRDVLYQAEQTSIGRQVALHILRAHLRAIPERRQEFLEFASVNANIRHPSILPVYEAGEENGVDFFAREFVVGRTLEEIREGGLTISALVALRVIRAIADAFAHLDDHEIPHAPIDISRIFVTPNDDVQLAEIAVANPAQAQQAPSQVEIRKLGRLLIPLTKAAAVPGAGRVLRLIHQMQTAGEDAITEWSALAQEAKTLEAILAPPPVFSPRKTGLLDKVKFWGRTG